MDHHIPDDAFMGRRTSLDSDDSSRMKMWRGLGTVTDEKRGSVLYFFIDLTDKHRQLGEAFQ